MDDGRVVVVPVGVGWIGGGVEAPEVGVAVGGQYRPELFGQVGHQLPLVVTETDLDLVVPPFEARIAALAQDHGLSCCMVAQRPCPCSRNTSISAFSRAPDDTTARPLW